MDRESFWRIHDQIEYDSIFLSRGRKPQHPVHFQLATFFIRAGAETSLKSASLIAIAEGSVYNHCRCVQRAIRRLMPEWISFPIAGDLGLDAEEMAAQGFPGAKGTADATGLPLETKPSTNAYAYFSGRKKFYGVCCYFFLSSISC
jgi:hypothetical protein